MPNRNPSLAVLIDAENVSARQVKAIHDTIETHGNPVLWRTYGSFTRLGMAAWNKYINEKPSMNQHDSGATGKNGADIALAIDATNLINTTDLGGICVVSADSDFAPLARHARRRGLAVYGFGRRCSPVFYRNACTRFYLIEELMRAPTRASTPPKGPPRRARHFIGKAIGDAGEGWADLSAIGIRLRQADPKFTPRDYGCSRLRKLIERCGGFEVRRRDGSVQVRRASNVRG